MADKIIFPIGFDLESAVKKAASDWDGKYASQLERTIQKRALAVKLKVDMKNLDSLDAVNQLLAQLKIQPITPETRTAIRVLAKELQALVKALEQVQKFSKTNQLGQQNFRNDVALEKLRQANERLEIQKRRVTLAEQKHAEAMKRSTTPSRELSQSFSEQSGYISYLLKRMAAYASYLKVNTFLRNVRDVTAEFELQRVSLGAIIQDQYRANQLFSEIKAFALQSPVKILDLTKYTKQLAAYKIETEELFETTKRLTDISVGLGVSMDRIILLYGQVRATGYLRASEVRQATEAGIPIVEELSKKLTIMNGELVRASDVMDMISKREIGFDLVKEVFEDMTDKGGAFYNMQIEQGNTLYGMWSKLGDAAQVMYDEIGNTGIVNQGMRDLIQALTDLMRHWRFWGKLILGAVPAYLAANLAMKSLRLAMVNYTRAGMAQTAMINQNILAQIRAVRATQSAGTWTRWSARMSLMHAQAQRQAAISTNIFSKALYSLKAAFLSNPLGMLIIAVTTLIALFANADDSAEQFAGRIGEINEKYAIKQANDARNFKKLAETAVNNADGSKEQKEALEELNRTYGDALGYENLRIDALRAMNHEYSEAISLLDEYNVKSKYEEREGATKEYYGGMKRSAFNELLDEAATIGFGDEELGREAAQKIILDIQNQILDALENGSDFDISDFKSEFIEQAGEVFKARGFKRGDIVAKGVASRLEGEAEEYLAVLKEERVELDNLNKARDEEIKKLNPYKGELDAITESIKVYTDAINEMDVTNIEKKTSEVVENIKNKINEITGQEIEASSASDIVAQIDSIINESQQKATDSLSKVKEYGTEILRSLGVDIEKIGARETAALSQIKQQVLKSLPTSDIAITWRKQFVNVYETFSSSNERIKASATKLNQYMIKNEETLSEYGKRIHDTTDNLKKEINDLSVTIARATTLGQTGEADRLKEMLNNKVLEKNFLEALNVPAPTDNRKHGSTKSDPRLQTLQEIANKMAEINKEYDELLKKEGQTKALADTQKLFASSFGQMRKTANKYGFKLPAFEVPKNTEDVQKWYKAIMDNIKRLNLKNADKVLIELGFKSDKAAIDKAQKDIEAQLKELSDRISRTKTAKDFYEKILGQTGDLELAANVSLQIYGSNGRELDDMVKEQMQKTFATIGNDHPELTQEVNAIIGRGAYEELRDYIDKLPEDARKAAEDLVKAQQQMSVKQYERWLKDLGKAKDFADKRIALQRYTMTQIAEIEDKIAKLNPQSKDYETQKRMLEGMIEGYKQREQKEAAKIEYDMFNDMPLYVLMFDNLDNASTTMLTNMKNLLEKNKDKWGEMLDPTQLKEMQSRMNEIDKQLVARNPFKTLSTSLKELWALKKSGRNRTDDEDATTKAIEAETAAYERWVAADKAYQEQLKLHGNDTENKDVKVAKGAADEAEKEYKGAKKASAAAQKQANAWKKIVDEIDEANKKIEGYQEQINNALDEVLDMMECFGVDAIDMEFFGSMKEGFNQILDGSQAAVSAFSQFATGHYFEGAMSSVSAITGIVSGISNLFSAGKVRRANKEIKRQQEILDQLEYTYSRLEKAAGKALGSDYINNFNQQQKVLQAEIEAKEKQLAAEKSKGKKTDSAKVKELTDSIRDLKDELADMQGDLIEHFTGTTRYDFVRQLAKSWIEARASMSDTFAAIKGDYKDMLKNMMVETMAAKLVENAFANLWESVDEMLNNNNTEGAVNAFVNGMDEALNNANNGLEVWWKAMEARGYDMKELLSVTDSDLTGIAKEVSSASSEEINANTAALNTQNYYVSHLPTISENVMAIRTLMEGGNVSVSKQSGVDVGALMQQSLENQAMIVRNTTETVAECRNIAAKCQEQTELIRKVIVPKNQTGGAYKVYVGI